MTEGRVQSVLLGADAAAGLDEVAAQVELAGDEGDERDRRARWSASTSLVIFCASRPKNSASRTRNASHSTSSSRNMTMAS